MRCVIKRLHCIHIDTATFLLIYYNDTGSLKNIYGKTCVKRPLKNRQTKVLMTNGSLMKVETIAECPLEHSAILLTCIKR